MQGRVIALAVEMIAAIAIVVKLDSTQQRLSRKRPCVVAFGPICCAVRLPTATKATRTYSAITPPSRSNRLVGVSAAGLARLRTRWR